MKPPAVGASVGSRFSERPGQARIYGRHGERSFSLEVAGRFWGRFCGLMLRRPLPGEAGLLLIHCSSIHTAFMRFALDVAYLNRAGQVIGCVRDLRPWRASIGPRGTNHTLELKAGDLERLGIEVGARIEHPALGEGVAR